MSPRLRRCTFTLWLLLAGSAAVWSQTTTAIRLLAGREPIEAGRIYLFSDVAVGAQSNPATLTLTNNGASVLTLGRDAVILTGGDRTMFAVIRQPVRVLPAGGSAPFRMVFTPTKAGPFMASVSVGSGGRPLFSFWVAGNGIPSE